MPEVGFGGPAFPTEVDGLPVVGVLEIPTDEERWTKEFRPDRQIFLITQSDRESLYEIWYASLRGSMWTVGGRQNHAPDLIRAMVMALGALVET